MGRLVSFLTLKRSLIFLIVVNFLGAVYGFYWYSGQLAATPARFWPVIPDSPTAVLLFALFLLQLYRKKPYRYLGSVAVAWVVKYGSWAVIINTSYYIITGNYSFENFHLTLSHFGMALEGIIFYRFVRPAPAEALAVTGLMVVSDFFDYVLNLHPYLFTPLQYGAAVISALILTAVISAWFLISARRR